MGAQFEGRSSARFMREQRAEVMAAYSGFSPARLTITGAAILVTLIALGTVFFLSSLHQRELTNNGKTLSNTASIVSGRIEELFKAVAKVQTDIIKTVKPYTNRGVSGLDRALSRHEFYLTLRDKALGMPYVGSLAIINAYGGLVNLSRSWPTPDIDSTKREYFKALKNNASQTTFIGEPVQNYANGTWVIHVARKISGPNGEILGLTTAAIKLGYLQGYLDRVASDAGSEITLFRNDGTLIARTPQVASSVGRRFPSAQAVKIVSKADSGTEVGVGRIVGVERIVAAHRVTGYPILVAATKPTETVFANWRHTAELTILATVFAIIAIIALAIMFINVLNKQNALADARAQHDLAEQFQNQGLRLDAALNNMSQGLVMFDSTEHLVLCNRRFMDMYGLSSDEVEPGRTLFEILCAQQERGSSIRDIEKIRSKIVGTIKQGKTRTTIVTNSRGRSFRVVNVPMVDGGWVGTHEDVTEKLNAEEINEQQKFQLDTALENMSQGLCLFDRDERLIISNKRYAELYGLSDDDIRPGVKLTHVLERRVAKGTAPTTYDSYRNERISLVRNRKSFQMTDVLADGRYISIIHRPTGDGGWVSTHEDVTEKWLAEQELDKTKSFLDSIIANIPVAVVVKDARTHRFVLANRTFQETLGLSGNDLIGKTVFDIYGPEDAERLERADSECLQGAVGVVEGEFEVDNPLLGRRILSTKRIVIRDAENGPQFLILVIDDITNRRRSEQQIAFLAHHDALTGLANRVTVVNKMEAAAARHRRWRESFSVLLLDLDRFKQINDTLGHSAGDSLLQEVACRLKALLRETDVLARLGGDEFAIIQLGEEYQREAARVLAERIISAVESPFKSEGADVNIGVSIGIALAPEHSTKPHELLKMADLALYRAKAAGRNCFQYYDDEMSIAANARRELETELREAIQQNQFELLYQPIIESSSGRIISAEALIRWRHPTKGLIAPDKFIPFSEEIGLISQIGEWVLETSFAEATKWPRGVKLAVNLSPAQFRNADLFDRVMSELNRSGLPPERLEFEITETALIEVAIECLPALRKFKELGISIALDDFGTGYSSLSHLTLFPFDKIKIDKVFTQNMTENAESAAIIVATTTMARSLEMATTAEGVETADQCRLLRLAGITSLQGYLFKRPCTATDIDFNAIYELSGGEDVEKSASKVVENNALTA